MAQIAKTEAKAETKSAPEKMYNLLKYNMNQFTNMFPQVFKSVQIIEGDAGQVGNLMVFEYVLGKAMTAKARTEEINDGERSITFRAVEGEILQLYSSFTTKFTANDGFVQLSFEYVKNNESVPNPDDYAQLGVKVMKGIDLYLLNH